MKQTSGPSVHQEVVREQPTFNKWLVAVCGVFSFGLSYGLPVSMTAMFIDWQDTFEESRANIAVINGVTIGLLMGAAIVPGYLMSRFGPRLTMMLGVVIASLGLFLQLFSYSVDYMVATIGVMGGLGFSMTNLPVIPRMTSTFTKYQSIVIAALTIGTALANASLPYLYRYLIHVYSWRGACVVISVITLNLLVFGMVLTSTVTSRGQPPLVFRAEDEETLEQLTHLEVLDGHQEESSPFQSIVTQVICNDTDTHEK
ncbi:monocarboxylate transporter 7, partial [Aplysia californica]|uniref:Monocarboxylate transporter 7 n=1 Tax=Aplysia californica TaxID=6500 RepID=A0ABM1ACK0_APLCA